MHVVLLSIAYPPEVRSASLLTFDFASELVKRGHEVTVVTGWPGTNIAASDQQRTFETVMIEDGVRVVRVRSLPVYKVSRFVRGIGELALPIAFAIAALRHAKKADIIEVYSPPLTLAFAGAFLKRIYRCPMILNAQDMFPQNMIDLGWIRPGAALSALLAMEKLAYRGADAITVHSPGNRDFLVDQRGQSSAKVRVIPNWVDTDDFDGKSAGTYRSQLGLNGAFVAIFAGVMGPAQGLERIVDAANELRHLPDLRILIAGDGIEKPGLVERCRARGQANVLFTDFVSKDEYPALLAECDLGLVSITSDYRTPVVPGKMMGYMASGLPVLAALNRESDGHGMLRESGAGLSVLSDDVQSVAAALEKLYRDRAGAAEMGRRGREYVTQNFNRERCVGMYDALFSELRSNSQS